VPGAEGIALQRSMTDIQVRCDAGISDAVPGIQNPELSFAAGSGGGDDIWEGRPRARSASPQN